MSHTIFVTIMSLMLLTTPRLLSPSLTDYDSSQLTPRLTQHSAPSLTTPCLTLASDGPAVAGMLAGSSHSALTPHTDDCDTLPLPPDTDNKPARSFGRTSHFVASYPAVPAPHELINTRHRHSSDLD